MMSFDEWLSCILKAARDIASREFQQAAWFFPGGQFVSSPEEVFQKLIEDNTFDLFFETYEGKFSAEEMRSANELQSRLEQYYDKMPMHPDPVQVLNDPEWEKVRQAARRFVENFSGHTNVG